MDDAVQALDRSRAAINELIGETVPVQHLGRIVRAVDDIEVAVRAMAQQIADLTPAKKEAKKDGSESPVK